MASAIRDPALPVPVGIMSAVNCATEKRFAVYRNNVAVSLREAMIDTYPVVRAIVGDEFFDAMAQVFVRATPPLTPVLLDYGAGFGDFISGFEPAHSVPYLADVARIEWAWTRAYHAVDIRPREISSLAGVDPSKSADVRLRLHPSLQLVASEWPVVSIWHMHQLGAETTPLPDVGQRALLIRPALEVEVRTIDERAFQFTSVLAGGATIGDAFAPFVDDANFDLSAHIAELFEIGAIAGIQIP